MYKANIVAIKLLSFKNHEFKICSILYVRRKKILPLMIGLCVVNVKHLDHPEHITVGQYHILLIACIWY